MNDGVEFGSDLSGGFFDAGDYMKFTFPLSFTMNVLSWSLEGIYFNVHFNVTSITNWSFDFGFMIL